MSNPTADAKELFLQAIELPTAQDRAFYLDEACQGNAELRARVERLLRSHDDPRSFMAQPAMADLATQTADQSDWDKDSGLHLPSDSELIDLLQPCTTPGRMGRLGVYEIIEVIGRGGFGVVLKAYDTKLQRVVAIKLLSPSLAHNANAVKRFLREARAAAAVSHEHVVTVFAVEEDSSPPYLVMECIVGKSLQQKIDQSGPLDPAEILRIGMQIAEGLAAAHRQGLVHRDIKPSNILLENGVERVTITDFGLARAIDDVTMTQTGHVAGTPEYMSPEQAMGGRLDHRSDLFSLGSVLYTMCTGRTAFRADSTMAVLRRVCDDTPRPIADLSPSIPNVLVATIEKLMAKRPQDRFQSATEVSELLSATLTWQQQPDAHKPPSVPTTPPTPKRTSIPLVVSLIICVALAIPIAAILIWQWPTLQLIANNQAVVEFYHGDPDTVVDIYLEDRYLHSQVGDGNVFLAPGNYRLVVQPKPYQELSVIWLQDRTWSQSPPPIHLEGPSESLFVRSGQQWRATILFGNKEIPLTPSPPSTPIAAAPFDAEEAIEFQKTWSDQLRIPIDYENPQGITFRLIPPGSFLMGTDSGESNAMVRELEVATAGEFEKFAVRSSTPQHEVELSKAFYLATHEVTLAQFKAFVEETGYQSTLEGRTPNRFTWKEMDISPESQDRPVIGVSWEDAKAYCRWLSSKHQGTYDLPTEAQWEFACRAGSVGRWSFGDDTILINESAVCDQPTDTPPAVVGTKKANPFGLFDMHGNADEWCLDWHSSIFYAMSPKLDPVQLTAGEDPASGRVVRGGNWLDLPLWTRSATRSYDFPGLPARHHGFRVAIVGDLSFTQGKSGAETANDQPKQETATESGETDS